MTVRQYSTPLAFKQALEQRLRSMSATGTDFGRRRQLLVFDRFLARLGSVAGDAVTLKGGLVLELRLERARTTKDVDLRMTGSPADALELFQEAGRLDLGDHMRFENLALLATTGPISAHDLRRAIDATFAHRNTHAVPAAVPRPPEAWGASYASMAAGDELPWRTLPQVTTAVAAFLDPVLGSTTGATWECDLWEWR